MAKSKKVVEESPLEALVLTLADQVKSLVDDIKSLKEANPLVSSPVSAPTDNIPATPQPTVTESTVYPVPIEYRECVDQELNKEFGVTIDPHPDAPLFTFTVVVPDKYSNMTPSQREINKADLRPKVISYAEGINAVREWSQRVFNNFSPEIRSLIVNDRMQP